MFSLFRRKGTQSLEQTFKKRVENFWEWYTEVAHRYYETIEDKASHSLEPEISAKVDDLSPRFAWVFGPGPDGNGNSLTLTGEGNLHLQFLTEYWKKQAPLLEGWTFYSSRQPSDDLQSWKIDIGGQSFDPLEFWIVPKVDHETEKIDITIWHPLFAALPEKDCWTVLFLALDEALGEFGTQSWIGEINMSDQSLADAFALKELPTFVTTTAAEVGWQKFPPTETFSGYRIKDPHDRFRRGDVITGTTCNMKLINEFLESEDKLEDPLAQTGADYVFVQFPSHILPEGKQAEARGQIEDALHDALCEAGVGQQLGGAHGTRFAYIDLLLFDTVKSLAIVEKVLRENALPKGTLIEFFADSKRGQRIVLQ
jgi:hypothetical protein